MRVGSFRDLQVYQGAFDAAMRIFHLPKGFPPEERYSLTDQVRRSSRSVCANVAEAWRKRRYPAAFVSKLSDADIHAELNDRYDHLCAQLVRMMAAPAQWCAAPGRADGRG